MSPRFYDVAVSLHNAKVTPPDGNGIFSHHYESTMTKCGLLPGHHLHVLSACV